MFRQILSSELRLQWRQPLFLVLLLVAPMFGYFVGQGISASQAELFQRFHLQQVTGALSMMALPWVTAILGVAVLFRDQLSGMAELTQALPVERVKLQGKVVVGLVLSIYALCFIAVCGLFGGLLTQAHVLPSLMELVRVFLHMQGLLLVLAMPALVLFLAMYWLLRNLAAPAIVIYLLALILFVAYMALSSASGSPLMAGAQAPDLIFKEIWSYLDWFGLTALFEKDIDWQVLVMNRILIITLSGIFVALALRTARKSSSVSKKAPKKATARGNDKAQLKPVKKGASKLAFVATSPRFITQLMALVRFNCGQLILHPGALFLGLLWMMILFAEVYPALDFAEVGATLHGLSLDAINRIMWDLVPLFGSVVMIYVSYTLTWRDHHHNFALVSESLPVSLAVRFASRLAVLLTVLSYFLVLTVAAAAMSQVLHSSSIQWLEYGYFIVFAGLPLALKGITFLAILGLIKHRVIALGLSLLILLFEFTPLPTLMGLTHPLFGLFTTPLSSADVMLGYAANEDGFWAFSVFWLLLTMTLVSLVFWRTVDVSTRFVRRVNVSVIVTLLILTGGQGYSIQQELAKDGKVLASPELLQLLADYERNYKSFADLPMPNIDNVDTKIEMFPQQRRVKISGAYTLSNPHDEPIDTILVGENWRSPLQELELLVPSQMIYDQEQGQYVFKLAAALAPGQHTTLRFSLQLQQSGYQALPSHKIMTSEFVYLRAIPYFPELGYLPIREIANNDFRRNYGLPPHSESSTEAKLRARDASKDRYDWSQLTTLVSAPKGYQTFSQGELVAEWQEGERVYRKYTTQEPVRRVQAFIATRAEVSKQSFDNQILQVAHLPQHRGNVAMTLAAMEHTTAFLSGSMGSFPGKTLTFIETPDLGPSGYALPQLVLIGSRIGFRARQDDGQPFSHAYRRAVHETAHQWFGHMLGNGVDEDNSFLIESMAKYVELVMLERHYGIDAMQALVDYERERYTHAENFNNQPMVSLISAESPHDRYSRATLVFAQLRAEMGDEPILAALAEVAQKHRYPQPPASSLDFVDALVAKAPEHEVLIERLLVEPRFKTK
ncbi:hypothetical protein [Pseudidiomarina aestuarii]|uniref:hypothetical protein n=1 Tax=Pseudidiomarina aestuarii TaxID=624146 RepID=UPI003A969927